MRFKFRSVMAAAISFGAAQAASAADLPARMPTKAPSPMVVSQTWTGCYIGGNVGVGHSRSDVNDEISGAPIASLTGTDVVGGGQVGCDYQFMGNWVIGLQGMVDASGLKADTSSIVATPGVSLHGSIPWFATATARLGYAAAPNLLIYGKGGGAWTHTDANLYVTGTGVVFDTGSFNQSGWTGGGGAEFMFAPNWSVFAEYDYLRFRDTTVTLASGGNIGTVHQDVQVGLIGVNYRFGGGMH